jgi:F-type H+-transporting ATPase subunit gamma
MQTVDALRRTIEAVEDLQTVVRTMKALSAVSIRQYEQALDSLTGYQRTVEMGLHVVLRQRGREAGMAPAERGARLGAVVLGSDHGLCGRFNEQISRFALAKMNGFQVRREDRVVLAVGARVEAQLEQAGHPAEECFFVPGSAASITNTVREILLKVDEWRAEHDVGNVLVFYNRRLSGVSAPTMVHLLPVDLARFSRLQAEPWPSHVLPTFTMDPRALFSALVRQHLFISVFRACAESLASEHASRLASMQGAEKNINERIEELGGEYRRQRQQSITEELLDVVAGFQALKKQQRAAPDISIVNNNK